MASRGRFICRGCLYQTSVTAGTDFQGTRKPLAELLLRRAHTLGELCGRAARMEKIPGITDLRPILDSLLNKGLSLYLTPPGLGCVVTHALYQEQDKDSDLWQMQFLRFRKRQLSK